MSALFKFFSIHLCILCMLCVFSTYTFAVTVHTYASQPRFHDSVNTHWVETSNSVIIIDTQRLLSEARQAIRHIKTLEKPVVAIFVTHAHSDHYGGLAEFTRAFPNAKVYANNETINSIRHDNRGYTAARKKRLGNDFVSQSALEASLPKHEVSNKDIIAIDNVAFHIHFVPLGEAEEGIVVYLPEQNTLFSADNLNNGFVPAPLESLDNWLTTLEKWKHIYSEDTLVYPGHGKPSSMKALRKEQIAFLKMLKAKVKNAIQDKSISTAHIERIAFEIEHAFPHHHGVGGNARFNVLKFVVELVAKQYGAQPQSSTEFR